MTKKTEQIDIWKIQDEEGVIHSGSEDQMDIPWDCMTMTLDQLFAYHDGDISKEDLQEEINKYKKPFTSDLKLVCIKKVYR